MFRAFATALTLAVGLPTALSAQDTTTTGVAVDLVIARSVVDRMPVDTGSVFPADVGQLAAWTRVRGAAGQTLQHVWIHGENEFPVPLEIGSPEWRTWSTKVIPPDWTGEWRVEVRDSTGNVLATAQVTVGS